MPFFQKKNQKKFRRSHWKNKKKKRFVMSSFELMEQNSEPSGSWFLIFFIYCFNWFVKYDCVLRLCLQVIRDPSFSILYCMLCAYWLTQLISEITSPFCLRIRNNYCSHMFIEVSEDDGGGFSTRTTSPLSCRVRSLDFQLTICKTLHSLYSSRPCISFHTVKMEDR